MDSFPKTDDKFPHEKDASFALFHFVKEIDALEKLVAEGINQSSEQEIQAFQDVAKEDKNKLQNYSDFFPNMMWRKYRDKLQKTPPKALCCSLAISSNVKDDQLGIDFFSTHGSIHGIGLVIEDPNKALVPHADYFALNSGGNLPVPLEKNDIVKQEIYKVSNLRKQGNNLEKPTRFGYFHISLGIVPITNYASYSRENKQIVDNPGGSKGFINFAKNFYRTSLHGKSEHNKPIFGKKSKYYPLIYGKRATAKYTELFVYQKQGEENPISGVVLNMNSLGFNKKDIEQLKELFTQNSRLALYIYDTTLETDCIRKISDASEIEEYLDFIKDEMQGNKLDYENNPNKGEIKTKNQSLPAFNNKILAPETGIAPQVEEAKSAPVECSPKPAVDYSDPKEKIKKEFTQFYVKLSDTDQVINFLKFLWGGGDNNIEYDNLKNDLINRLKVSYTGTDAETKLKASKFINEVNRKTAIEKLESLNQEEQNQEKKAKVQEFIDKYDKIYRHNRFDVFLQQDEFQARKQEMCNFCESKNYPDRLNLIESLQEQLQYSNSKFGNLEILDFLKSISSTSEDDNELKKLWKDYNNSIGAFETNQQNVFKRDFLLILTNTLEDQEFKDALNSHIQEKYKDDNFLTTLENFFKQQGINKDSSLEQPLTPYPAAAPPPPIDQNNEPATELQKNQNYIDPIVSILGCAGVGAIAGIGAGLFVSTLGIGIIATAPVLATVAIGATIGIGAGAIAGYAISQTTITNPQYLDFIKIPAQIAIMQNNLLAFE